MKIPFHRTLCSIPFFGRTSKKIARLMKSSRQDSIAQRSRVWLGWSIAVSLSDVRHPLASRLHTAPSVRTDGCRLQTATVLSSHNFYWFPSLSTKCSSDIYPVITDRNKSSRLLRYLGVFHVSTQDAERRP